MSNLLPKNQKIAIVDMYRKRLVSLSLAAFAVLCIVGSLLLLPSLLLLKSNQIVLTAKRDTLANFETSKIAESLASTVADINSRLAIFPNAASTDSPVIAGLLDPALKSKTKAIHLTMFTYDPGDKGTEAKIKISGTADSRGDLLDYVERIKATNSFDSVMVPITSFIKDSDVTFTVSANVPVKS